LGATLPDTDEWLEILLESRVHGRSWTDPSFPPHNTSLYKSASLDQRPSFSKKVAGWARINDICRRRHIFKFSFSEEENPQCCGFKSPTDDAPKFTGPVDKRFLVAAIKAAKELVVSAFSSSVDDRSANVNKFGGLMADSLNSANIFGKIEESLLPLHYADIVDEKTYVVGRDAEPGYIPMLHIQITVQFSAIGGAPKLFDVGTGNDLISSNDVFQGELGDCYLLGALSVLGCNSDQIMKIFPLGESGQVQGCKFAPVVVKFILS